MLNYFLQHLVGPKMGALKVKDFSEFDFKPQQLVSDICTIYLNLGYVVTLFFLQQIHGGNEDNREETKKKKKHLAVFVYFVFFA